jgi:hypothetical protein
MHAYIRPTTNAIGTVISAPILLAEKSDSSLQTGRLTLAIARDGNSSDVEIYLSVVVELLGADETWSELVRSGKTAALTFPLSSDSDFNGRYVWKRVGVSVRYTVTSESEVGIFMTDGVASDATVTTWHPLPYVLIHDNDLSTLIGAKLGSPPAHHFQGFIDDFCIDGSASPVPITSLPEENVPCDHNEYVQVHDDQNVTCV